ncbi:MAG: SEC-C metal-binding domain-containing protein [Vicinamibacteraceae bacterium]
MTTHPATGDRPGRNAPCRCGSGRKYKQCCLDSDEAEDRAVRARAAEEAPPTTDAASVPRRPPKPQIEQPWKKTSTRSFFQRVRTPRKVGGG